MALAAGVTKTAVDAATQIAKVVTWTAQTREVLFIDGKQVSDGYALAQMILEYGRTLLSVPTATFVFSVIFISRFKESIVELLGRMIAGPGGTKFNEKSKEGNKRTEEPSTSSKNRKGR
jgi:hypothetical protein